MVIKEKCGNSQKKFVLESSWRPVFMSEVVSVFLPFTYKPSTTKSKTIRQLRLPHSNKVSKPTETSACNLGYVHSSALK